MRTKALSVRQPHAEAIMRGIKTVEQRLSPTKNRGRIYIYASLQRYSGEAELEMLVEYGLPDLDADALPRGVIVGTVELTDCQGGDWHLENPERADELLKPAKQPQPVWFYPF